MHFRRSAPETMLFGVPCGGHVGRLLAFGGMRHFRRACGKFFVVLQ
jgi:hypothetical protein